MKTIVFCFSAFFLCCAAGIAITLYRATQGISDAPIANLGETNDILAGNINPAALPTLTSSAPSDSREAVGRAVANILKGAVEGSKK